MPVTLLTILIGLLLSGIYCLEEATYSPPYKKYASQLVWWQQTPSYTPMWVYNFSRTASEGVIARVQKFGHLTFSIKLVRLEAYFCQVTHSYDNKAKAPLRLDAGEVIGDWKNVYLQVNSQAQNEALAKFRKKNGTDAKLASGKINVKTPEKEQEEAAKALWDKLASDAKKKLG